MAKIVSLVGWSISSSPLARWPNIDTQVVYAMGPRRPFSKHVLPKVKIMTDGESVDVNSGNSS